MAQRAGRTEDSAHRATCIQLVSGVCVLVCRVVRLVPFLRRRLLVRPHCICGCGCGIGGACCCCACPAIAPPHCHDHCAGGASVARGGGAALVSLLPRPHPSSSPRKREGTTTHSRHRDTAQMRCRDVQTATGAVCQRSPAGAAPEQADSHVRDRLTHNCNRVD